MMTPQENFDHRLLLANGVLTAHLIRCAHKAGILDGDAMKSVAAHFKDLSEGAVELDSPQVLAWMDMLARILPPLGSDGNSQQK